MGVFRGRSVAFIAGALAVSAVFVGVPANVTATEPGAPVGQDMVITPGDLAFVLRQIEIAEAHARRVVEENRPDASPLCSDNAVFDDDLFDQVWRELNGEPCVGSPLLPHGLRTVDGRWNNLQPGQDGYGAASRAFPRLLTPEFDDAQPMIDMGPGQPPTQPAGSPTSYTQTDGVVIDREPREISNLIVDQTTNNPAAVAKLLQFLDEGLDAQVLVPAEPGAVVSDPVDLSMLEGVDGVVGLSAEDVMSLDGYPIFLQNVATDEGLSAPFSSWMTFFGQFFDHGLDLVSKGGNGTVIVPLHPSDPLYVAGSHTNFVPLSRATRIEGDPQNHLNRTTPFIDQNQTYTSHASHQVFLREYKMVRRDGTGDCAPPADPPPPVPAEDCVPVPTGLLLEGPDEGLATWADVKLQAATKLGILLDDGDVLAVPLVHADQYGRFIAGPNGFPQLATEDGFIEGDLADPIVTDGPDAGHAFLDDIAGTATPGQVGHDGLPLAYDAELLDRYYVAGDGRVNENIALTASHHIFHSEHNRLVGQVEAVINQDILAGDLRGLDAGFHRDGFWDYEERLFQAARFFNEMQYQHLAVEEFLRAVAPTMDVQPLNESAYHSELNAAITAEFGHVVYRFGHSMLTETLPRVYDDGSSGATSLLDGFLNPDGFTENGALTPDQAAASIIRGLASQVGNGIDEFVSDTLRNKLLGIPLDLPTINITRARDTGIPSLQTARRQFYASTLDPTLAPYADWADFERNLKHSESIINFIAAYGTGDEGYGGGTTTFATIDDGDFAARRARATELAADEAYMDLDAELVGLNDVDFWVGGLAERTMVFGGMLGSSFNFVFEQQAELLQNADRFYYLSRTQGQNFLSQLEGNSFTELIQRNTSATAAPLDIFTWPSHTFLVDELLDVADNKINEPWPTDLIHANGTVQYKGAEHVVIYGRNTHDDNLRGGIGDDTLWGRDGNDTIEGDDGVDSLMGGDGDDVLTDINGDDVFIAGSGNDAVRAGAGADLVLSGSGADFVMMTKDDLGNSFNGVGNDIILGGTGSDRIWAGDGDDWVEGGTGHDLLQGDNAIVFQNDPWGGHDVLLGGPGNNDLDSDGGDDVLVQGPGTDRNEGMLGFDWVTYKGHNLPVDADLGFGVLLPPDVAAIRDRFDLVEGLSGWKNNDVLRGMVGLDDVVGRAQYDPNGHELTEAHLDRVGGLRQLLQPAGHLNYGCRFLLGGVCDIPLSDSDGISNLLIGGAGSDLIEGRAGDDFIDGDSWFDVYLEWVNPAGATQRFDSALEFGDLVMNRTIDPADLRIRREVVGPGADDSPDHVDTSVYAGPRAEYSARYHGDGYWEVFHFGAAELEEGEGRDILKNIEALQFSDDCVLLEEVEPVPNAPFTPIVDLGFEPCGSFGSIELFGGENPIEGTAITAEVTFNEGIEANDITWVWQFGEGGEEWEPTSIASNEPTETTSEFVPDDPIPANLVRAIVQFTDGNGILRQIVSGATNEVENINDLPVGPFLLPEVVASGTVLTATGFSDDDGIESIVEDQTVSYVWEQSCDSGTTWTLIADTGTDPFLQVTTGQIGCIVRVSVSYIDDHGTDETAVSAPTSVVLGSLPNAAPTGALSLLPAVPQVDEPIMVNTSAIADADGPANQFMDFQYQWFRDDGAGGWTPIDGATLHVFQPTAALQGVALKVEVSYLDDGGTTEKLEAATAAVLAPVDPPPAVPTGLSAVGGEGAIQVTWNANPETGTDLAGYRLYRKPTSGVAIDPANLVAELAPGVTSYLDTVAPGSTWFYVVVAHDVAGGVSLPTAERQATANAPAPVLADFEAITPARLFDTRPGAPAGLRSVPKQLLLPGQSLAVQVTNLAGLVPASGVGAVAVNVTVADPQAGGWLSVAPCGSSNLSSSLNFNAGEARANTVLTAVPANGMVCFQSSVATHILADISGWFPTSGDFNAIAPDRVFDTRPGTPEGLRPVAKTPLLADQALAVRLTDLPGGLIPATGVGAVSLNVTVAAPSAGGWLAVYPCGTSNLSSSVNFEPGGATANAVLTAVPSNGQVCFRSSVDTHLLVDVNGWFPTTSDFHAVAPDRVFDTRPGTPPALRSVPKVQVGPGTPLAVKMTDLGGVVPATGVGAVSLNVTVTGSAAGGWVGVAPCGSSNVTSSVNFQAGVTTANAVLTAVPVDGQVCFVSSTNAHLVVDINGWFAD